MANTILDDLDDMIGPLGAATEALSGLDDMLASMNTSLSTSGAALGQASAIVDRMDAAAAAAGVSVATMAAAITDLNTKAEQAKVLQEAKKALDDLTGVSPKPVDEVTAAMQRLTKQAHETKVLDEAKRRLGMMEPPAKASGAAMQALGDQANNALDRLRPTSGVLGTISSVLESMGPKGRAIALVLAAIVTVATAAAAALWGLVKAAVTLSQEKDALAATFDAITEGATGGLKIVNELSEVAARLPFGEEKVLAWGKAMAAAGKSGAELEQSLVAIASSGAIMRDNGDAALAFSKRLQTAADVGEKIKLDRRMQRMLAETGVRASELAKALGIPEQSLSKISVDAGKLGDAFEKALISKGAGALNRMSLTWTSISAKLGDAWEDLFEDMGSAVDPLMTAVRDLFSEFFTGATLQEGTKGIVTSVLKTILDWATRVIRAVHIGFLELQIGALKAYIMFAPLISVLKMVLTNAEFLRGIKTILVIIAAAIGLVIAGVGVMGAAFATATGLAVTAFGAVQGAILWVIGLITGFVQAMITGGTEGGSGFITGLIDGIKAGATAVANAVSDVAKNAEAAFTGFFEIRSPSRRMYRHGRQLPAGAAEGADDGAIQLEKSIDDIWRVPTQGKGGRRGGGRGRLAETINFVFQGRKDDFEDFRAFIEKWLDQQEAAGPEPEPA